MAREQAALRADVAIVGMSLALPAAANPAELHQSLARGTDSVQAIPAERFELLGYAPVAGHLPAALLSAIAHFDYAFFGLSPREARAMDPHQRLLLQLAWHAIEDAGHAPGRLRRRPVGVYLTAFQPGYRRLLGELDTTALLGTMPAALAGRVSYLLGLEGPSLVVDTGCSSGLVALQLASAAIREGSCEAALVGGVSLRTTLDANLAGDNYPELLSTSGKCRAFDAAADGTSDGEGGVVLLVKRLEQALADGDHIRGVVRSAVVSHNGERSNGFSAPSPQAQVELLSRAWRQAGVSAGDLHFVEAHGSGTKLGDAIELTAVQTALRQLPGSNGGTCQIGSVKTNIGHLDHVAGLAGLAKALVGLEHEYIYPSLHYQIPNPMAQWDGSVTVATGRHAATSAGSAVGVSAFSLTGTNAHVVVGRGPSGADVPAPAADLVTVSASSGAALRRNARTLWHHVVQHRDVPWWQIAHVLNAGRDDLAHRLAFVATSYESLRDGLYECTLRGEVDRRPGTELVLHSGGPVTPQLRAELARFPAYRQGAATSTPADQPADQPADLRAVLTDLGLAPVVAPAEGQVPAPGPGQEPGPLLTLRHPDGGTRSLLPVPGSGSGLLSALATLYEHGFDLDWDAYYAGRRVPRVPLPGYQFEPTWCWPDPLPTAAPAIEPASPAARPAPVVGEEPVVARTAELWHQVLGTTPAGAGAPDDPHFFAAGGNSVLALELLARLAQEFGSRLKLVDLYEHPTLSELVALVTDQSPRGSDTVVPRRPGDGSSYQPSFGQESLWILEQRWPDLGMYNIPIDIPLIGELDPAALRAAFGQLIERHETLRSRIVTRDGEPLVLVDADPSPDFQHIDLRASDKSAEEIWEDAYALARPEGVRPFRLDRDRPMRIRLYQLGDQEFLLLLVTHHSVDDGWTPGLFIDELAEFYSAHRELRPPRLPALPVQYGDFATWQRAYWSEDRLAAERDFWRGRLASVRPSNLPTDHPRPARQSGRGLHHRFTLDRELAAAARRLSNEQGVSLFIVLMSAFKATLARWSGERDITVGITTAGRDQPELRNLIGYFNNAVALRTDLGGDPSFEELLTREREVVASALEHDALPFAEVVAAVAPDRSPSRHPIFQVGATYQNLPAAAEYLVPGVRIDRTRTQRLTGLPSGTAKWDLDLAVWDRVGEAELPGALEASSDLFEAATIAALAESYSQVLREVTSRPDTRLSQLTVASPEQRTRELAQGQGPRLEVGVDDQPLRRLDATAGQWPGRPFVRDRHRELTYREVRERSLALAHRMHQYGVPPGARVATLLTRGTDTVVAIFAAWRAGCAWVPLEPGLPAPRHQFIATDAAVDLLLIDEATAEAAASIGHGRTMLLGETGPPTPPRGDPPSPLLEAYVIYTSGSTGEPKGVVVSAPALSHYCAHWAGVLPAGASLLTTASPGFDVFIGDVLRALAAAGTITIASYAEVADPPQLAALLDRHRVDVMEIAPAAVRRGLVAHLAGERKRSPLRLLINGSEIWSGAELAAAKPGLAESGQIMNLYGVTECTIDSLTFLDNGTVAVVDDVPVGAPMANTTVYLLEPATLQPVPPGGVGEIYIGGPRVADGYTGRPAMTAERFIPDPYGRGSRLYRTGDLGRRGPDGQLRFLGRLDRQLNINGFRIEPGEVEAALRRDSAVADAVVTAVTRPGGEPVLAALIERNPAAPPAPIDELRRQLGRQLPPQLVPSLIVPVERLPRLANAKPDLAAAASLLNAATEPKPAAAGPAAAPKDPIDLELTQLVSTLLGREVGLDHDFFTAGGTSLQAIRLLAEVRQRFGVELPVVTMFEAPTAAALAEEVRRRQGDGAEPARVIVPLRPGTPAEPALFLVHASGGEVLSYYRFAQLLPPGLRVYGVRSSQPEERDHEPVGLPELATIYLRELTPMLPAGAPLLVAGWSFGGVLAFELARQWQAAGGRVAFLGLIEAEPDPPPHSFSDDEADILIGMVQLNRGVVIDPGEGPPTQRFARVAEQARIAGVVSRHTSDEELRRLVRVNLRNDAALARYRPASFAGHGHVFRGQAGDSQRPPDLGWSPLLDSVTSVEVPGGHYDLFSEYSDKLSEIVGRELLATGLIGGPLARP